jgi:hypothetical protein
MSQGRDESKGSRREPKLWAGGTPTFDERSGRYRRGKAAGEGLAMAIGTELKHKIEAWLKATGRNEFGDPADTLYAGGTPLFDERSGQTKDRYEHILERHPEVRDWEAGQ